MIRTQWLTLLIPLVMFTPILLGFNYQPETVVLLMLGWMLAWWWSEFIPMGMVGLIPLLILPVFQIVPLKIVTAQYADPVIFLFIGGFLLARAIEKSNLSDFLATFLLKNLATSDKMIIIVFVITTAFLSMWISNTATTMMMIPIASSIIIAMKTFATPNTQTSDLKNFSMSIMLAIAYSASLGGLMTPIGTPPNVVFLAYLRDHSSDTISFGQWLMLTFPIAIAILSAMTLFLFYGPFRFKIDLNEDIKAQLEVLYRQNSKLDSKQKLTLFIFILAIILWVGKDLWNSLIGFQALEDSTIGVFLGLLLFILPSSLHGSRTPILDKEDISTLPWDVIFLFGGGLALGMSMDKTGILSSIINLLNQPSYQSVYWQIFALMILVLILTELMSNVALCAVIIPLAMTWAKGYGQSELMIGLMVCLTTSFGFSLPISTPPNTLAFSTGHIPFKSMIKIGLGLNIFSIITLMTLGYFWIHFILK